jgi:NADH:ubiquinone oxidoreductase subunit E
MGSLTRLNAYGFQSPYQSEETKKQIGEYEQQIKILKRILQEHKANAPRDNESAIADIERTIAEAEKHVADLYSQLTSNRAE